MAKIQILSEETIDKIAAGEVVERPSSVVKELVENAIDAGATAVTVEIKEGGISFIRVTDNGEGIEKSQIQNAFYRHATSKLHDASELSAIETLGFRGEALSSIAAVSQVELITKTDNDLTGVRYVIEGAVEKEMQEVGIPKGTTIIVKNLFFNTPVRRKFLKSPTTEASYINELCERMALSKPDVAFQFIQNGQMKFHTSGNGDIQELVYRIYGKEIAKELIPVNQKGRDIAIYGVLGKPTICRANRNFENYFVNGRYIKSSLISKAVEDGYASHMMQHKFPFFILNIDVSPEMVDVNVHPTKMDVRFSNNEYFYDYISSTISAVLKMQELIPQVSLAEEKIENVKQAEPKAPEPFEKVRMTETGNEVLRNGFLAEERAPYHAVVSTNNVEDNSTFLQPKTVLEAGPLPSIIGTPKNEDTSLQNAVSNNVIKADQVVYIKQPEQMSLLETPFLSKEAETEYEILGQLFDTYWLIAYGEKLLIMDQHAAHEKVKYERLVKHFKEKTIETQTLNPPVIISMSSKERTILEEYMKYFEELGFTLEDFGSNEIAIRNVPLDLYGQNEKDMFLSLLDELCSDIPRGKQELIYEKIASMSCKAAVKGNNRLSRDEVKELIRELMTLDNPYHCPHGRPTIISMTKYELEKKFKRII